MACEGQLWLFAFTINHDINYISGKSIVVRLWYKVLQEPAQICMKKILMGSSDLGSATSNFVPPQKNKKKIPKKLNKEHHDEFGIVHSYIPVLLTVLQLWHVLSS